MNDADELKSERQYLCDMIQSRYGNRLSAEAVEEVKKGVDGVVKAAAALRAVPLSNSDEPMICFIPYREES